MPPILIGVAGASGSGKTERARALLKHLPGTATLFTLDSYYRCFAHLSVEERAHLNFDSPDSLDHRELIAHLRQLASGQAIEPYEYSFHTHTRTRVRQCIVPTRYIVVEGIFALYWPEVRDLLQLKVYVDAPDQLCLERRLARDVAERGRTPESIIEQYNATVRPMAFQYIRPTSQYADLILDGTASIEEACKTILCELELVVADDLHATQSLGIAHNSLE